VQIIYRYFHAAVLIFFILRVSEFNRYSFKDPAEKPVQLSLSLLENPQAFAPFLYPENAAEKYQFSISEGIKCHQTQLVYVIYFSDDNPPPVPPHVLSDFVVSPPPWL